MPEAASGVTTLLAFARTASLAYCARASHAEEAAHAALGMADVLRLSGAEREAVYYGSLLKHAGHTVAEAHLNRFMDVDTVGPMTDFVLVDKHDPAGLSAWMAARMADPAFARRLAMLVSFLTAFGPELRRAMTLSCERAEACAAAFGFPAHVQRALSLQMERWDGLGDVFGFAGLSVPAASYVIQLADLVTLAHAQGGATAAHEVARAAAGRLVPADIADAYRQAASAPTFWTGRDRAEEIVARAPPTAAGAGGGTSWGSAVCDAIGAFVDARTPADPTHSRDVAGLASAVARTMGLGEDECARVRCAGLAHDLGKVTVPFSALAKRLAGAALSRAERERVRDHPRHAAAILGASPELAALAPLAASHHERVDGRGFHRGLAGGAIPLGGRVLAVANDFVHRSHRGGDSRRVLRTMRALAGAAFDGECLEALATTVLRGGWRLPQPPTPPPRLTPREAEVFALLARGASTARIAGELVVSAKTVEGHLTRIYAKMGVGSRAEALALAGAGRPR